MTFSAERDVIVVGAGYAGVLAANRLAAYGHRVTLVSDGDDFVERVRLHEVVAGVRASAGRPLGRVVRPTVTHVRERVTAIREDGVDLAGGERLSAPQVLWATGSRPRDVHPHWVPVGSPDGADTARRRVSGLPAGAIVTVHGGGLSGIETAAEVAERHPRLKVRLADPKGPGRGLPSEARRHVERTLGCLGVAVESFGGPSDLDLDCTGFLPASSAGLPGGEGPLTVDRHLRASGWDRWWGAGDAVAVDSTAYLRMGCAAALPMAAVAADNLHAASRGRDLRPFDFGYLIQCVSLGRRDGVIVWVERDDTPTGRVWTGRRAAVTKEIVCRMAVTVAASGGRLYGWRKGPR